MKIDNYKSFATFLDGLDHRPNLLLHSCCAPCSSHTIDFLNQYFEISIFYSNDNIYPREEYFYRLEEQKNFIDKYNHSIHLLYDDYNDKDYYKAIKGVDKSKEGGERCYQCYLLRLEKTVQKAKELKFDYFSTTLSISPFKNSNWLNEMGFALQEKYQVAYLYSNFKKNDGYKKSIAFSQAYNLYRQDYCGCVFSLKESQQRKQKRS